MAGLESWMEQYEFMNWDLGLRDLCDNGQYNMRWLFGGYGLELRKLFVLGIRHVYG